MNNTEQINMKKVFAILVALIVALLMSNLHTRAQTTDQFRNFKTVQLNHGNTQFYMLQPANFIK